MLKDCPHTIAAIANWFRTHTQRGIDMHMYGYGENGSHAAGKLMRQVSKWVTIFKVINSPSGCQRDFEHWIDLWPRDVKWMQDKLTVVYILAAGDRSQTIRARVPLPRPRPSPKRNSLSWPSHSGCNWSEVKRGLGGASSMGYGP